MLLGVLIESGKITVTWLSFKISLQYDSVKVLTRLLASEPWHYLGAHRIQTHFGKQDLGFWLTPLSAFHVSQFSRPVHLGSFLYMGNYFSCKSQNQSSNISASIQDALKWGSIILTLVGLIWNDTAWRERHQRKMWSPVSGFWSHLCAAEKWINFTPKPQKLNLLTSCREETTSRASYQASPAHLNSLSAETSPIVTARPVFISLIHCFPIVPKDLQILGKFPAFQFDHKPSLKRLSHSLLWVRFMKWVWWLSN